VYAGTIGMTNSLETFFKAAELLQDNTNIRFIIVGDGSYRKKYIKNYGHLSNLIYFTKIKKNQVQSFLSYADVLYFSTFKSKVYDYGQSANKIIDYMISKKPILISYSGYPSMINEAKCGYFVPAENPYALVKKIKEMKSMTKSKLRVMGVRGRSWILKNRKYDILADNYLNLIFKSKN
jgi:glycosyltransferase involved in cell wall biosynthesis